MHHRASLPATLATALAAALFCAPARAQTQPPSMISVTGEARISAQPDLAQIEGGAPAPIVFRRMAAAPESAPIAQGEETLQLSVSVSWAIKPAQ